MRLSGRWIWTLRALLSVALISTIILRVGPRRLADTLREADATFLLLVFLLGVPRIGIKTMRWRLLARAAVRDVPWNLALKSLLVGTAAALVTPGRVGQASSSLLFPKGGRVALSGLALLDPICDLLIVVVLAGVVILGPIPALLLGALIGLLALSTTRIGRLLTSRGGRLGLVGSALEAITPKTLILLIVLSLGIYCMNLVQFHLLLNAHAPVSFLVSAESLPFIFLAVAFPITIAGFGVREAAAALVLAQHGIENSVAVQTSFVLFVINLLIPGLIGAALASRIGTRGKAVS